MSSTTHPREKKALSALVSSSRKSKIKNNQKHAYAMLCAAAKNNPPDAMHEYGKLYDNGVAYMNLAEMCSENPELVAEYFGKADRLFYDVYAICRAYAVRK